MKELYNTKLPINSGALRDRPDKRDYKAEEILAGVIVQRPPFKEGYSVIKNVWADMPYKDQKKTFSCVGQAAALYKQILQKLDTGEQTELSAFSLYNPVAVPGVGSYVRDVMMRSKEYGVNKESTLSSPPDEETMTRKFDFTPYQEEAAFYKNRIVATISTQDFEKLADMLFLNNGFISGWGTHAVYFGEYGLADGKRFFKTPNSYGQGQDLYYFEGSPQPLFSAWTAIDLKIVQADSDALYADLKYGDSGNEVLRLKKALARLGWSTKDLSNQYNDDLKELVWNYSLANLTRYGWSWWWHFLYYKGKVVDATIRESINFNLSKK